MIRMENSNMSEFNELVISLKKAGLLVHTLIVHIIRVKECRALSINNC